MRVKTLSPELGYRKDWLWLPLKHMKSIQGIQNSLTFYLPDRTRVDAWGLTENHLVVPREFLPFDEWGTLPFEIEDASYTQFPKLEGAQMRSELRGPVQFTSASIMSDRGSGILSLACGAGKTVVALDRWVWAQTPGLIVVHTIDLEQQWRDRIVEHTTLRAEDVGTIRGDRWDWEHPLCIASIQTLASRMDSEEFPEEMRNHFGVGIYDEVHHLGAPEFNTTAGLIKGIRWGLSATPGRRDGCDMLYQHHLGGVLYSNYEQDVIPETWFVRTGRRLDHVDFAKAMDRLGELNIPKLWTLLSEDERRNAQIHSWIEPLLLEGRKPLFLSPRVEHVEKMFGLYKDRPSVKAGMIHGKHKGVDRAEVLNNCNLIFAILQLAKEGLDRKDLDCLILPFGISDEGMLRQVYGRIQRPVLNKKVPVVIVFEDEFIRPMHTACKKMRHLLTNLRYPFEIARGT